jgi:GNAT superfamily N-acetyltransferase
VSDGVTFAYLADVFVLPEHRGDGRGRALVDEMVARGPFAGVRWYLRTADAHGLYARFGFAPATPETMERPPP